ncbi:hypothetical protein EI427_21550 [Flammeovirga pectinis]|uniref:Uncharacterized protein n=1 Tax=Flammeovirga pectinis TaxID=2494373 RepID=A0A3Q9FUF1_9BACT|nr:hypothetical protein [Flammeovirga pectinis]AZQ64813.1 hypothetical protein EI427_21550 [Flammeovirga pectinis]
MRYILFLVLFFTLEVLHAQTYPSLSQLKQQQALFQQQQLEDSLLQMGEVPQLVPFVGGRVGTMPFNPKVQEGDIALNENWSIAPYLTTGLSYRYKRWELEALFGLNISFNTDSLNLDIAERWLAESKLKYRLGEQRKGMLTLGHGWQAHTNYISMGGGYAWKNKKDKIITLHTDINYHYQYNDWGILAGVTLGFGKKGIDQVIKSNVNGFDPNKEIQSPNLKLLDKFMDMQNMSLGEGIGMLSKALNIGNTVTISQQDPLKVTYSPSIQLPLSEAWSVGIGPNISMLYDSLNTNWSFGGRAFTRVQPKKWLPYLQIEYSGLYEADSVNITKEGVEKTTASRWKSDVLIGAGYSLKVGRLFSIEASAMRKTGWIDKVDNNPWVFQLSTKKDIPFANPELDQLEIPNAQVDLGKFLKVGGGINLTVGENPGIEVAPQLYKTLGAKKKTDIGISPLLRYSRAEGDKDLWIYGGRVFSKYTPFKGYPHLDAEIEGMNASDPTKPEYKRHWYPSLRAGTGYTYQFGDFFGISFQLLYSFVYEEDSNPIQNEPWVFRVGFNGLGGIKLFLSITLIRLANFLTF